MRVLPFLLGGITSTAWANEDFHPRSYAKTIAHCPAVNRQTQVASTIDISYVELNKDAKTTLLLVHGWPSLWSSWSNQILAFQDSYHLLVPDLRGFGGSTHPGDVENSGTMGDLVGDLVCLLQNAGVSHAICLGHDWGSQLCYEAARMRPELFKGVVGVTVPYMSAAGPYTPIEELARHFQYLRYQVYFQKETEKAISELNKDIRRSLRSTYRTIDSAPPSPFLTSTTDFLGAYPEEIPPSAFFSQEEEDYIVEQYEKQKFDHTLQFYMHGNRLAGHTFNQQQGNHTIPQPSLAIYPTQDRVANWVTIESLVQTRKFVPNFKSELLRAAHWPHLEAPEEFNKILKDWLDEFESSGEHRIVDEL